MILIDANLLLYAYDSTSAYHDAAREWLETVISDETAVRLAWPVILAFLRISTNYRAVSVPLEEREACRIVSDLLDQPAVALLQPGPAHWKILAKLIEQSGARGPLVMDAHLAALAIEHGAILCTHDRDFARFPALRTEYPLAITGPGERTTSP